MTDAGPWLTIAELADRLGRSESGVREWRRAGRDQVPHVLGRDGIRRYPLSVFERIAMLRREGVPLARVRDALAEADSEPAPSDRTVELLERIAVALERIADHLAPPET